MERLPDPQGNAAPTRPDSGFALLELVVAATLLVVSLAAITSSLGVQDESVHSSTAEQVAVGLLDQALEEIRALPYATVASGLSNSDSTVATDSRISVTGTAPDQTWTFVPTGEVIPHSAVSTSQPPIIPHIATDTVNAVTYTVAAYPSIVTACTCSGVYRVTVVVSWQADKALAANGSISGQTFVFSVSSGCLNDTNHPFAAPCQPFFYAGAVAGGGSVVVTGTGSQPVDGVTFTSLELLLDKAVATEQIEQTSSALAHADTTGASLTTGSTTSEGSLSDCSAGSSCGESASVADNDPGSSIASSQSATASQPSGMSMLEAQSGGGHDNWIGVVPGTTDSGATVATGLAYASTGCDDLAGNAQATGYTCANGSITQSGSAGALQMGLWSGNESLGTTTLASVSAQPSADPTESYVTRYTKAGTAECTSTSGDGCVHSGAQLALGTVSVGGLPAEFLSDGAKPSGWGGSSSNYLFQLSNYSAQANAESGVSPASPSAVVPIPGTTTPTLTYWNGSGYTSKSVNWGSSPPTITIPSVSVTDTDVPDDPTVSMSASVALGGWTTSTSTNSGCSTPCTAGATVSAVVQGTVTYTVTDSTGTLASLSIAVNLGELVLSTSYQAAP